MVDVSGAQGDLAALLHENAVLKARLAECEASAERFRSIVEHASDAYLLFDRTGILDCNRASIAMLRCTDKQQVLSLHPAVLSPDVQPDGRRSLEKSVEMDRTAQERGFHRFQWTHRRMTGEDFPVEVTLTPVELRSGPAMVVTWHDLSELQAREEALRRQDDVIRRLSTPVIAVGEGALLLPLVGPFDARRANETTTALLDAISTQRARTVIVDLTGVEDFDSATAEHILRLCNASSLLGASAVLAGITPGVARSVIALGTDLSRTRTVSDVAEALRQLLAG